MSRESRVILSEKQANESVEDAVIDDESISVIPDSLLRLSSDLAGDAEPSAPVRIPDRKKLTIYLADINLLQHLDETRNDMNIWQGAFWTLLGWIAGFLTNIFTSNQSIDKTGWVFLVILCSMAALTGLMTLRARRRAEVLRKKIYSEAIEGKTGQ